MRLSKPTTVQLTRSRYVLGVRAHKYFYAQKVWLRCESGPSELGSGAVCGDGGVRAQAVRRWRVFVALQVARRLRVVAAVRCYQRLRLRQFRRRCVRSRPLPPARTLPRANARYT